MKAEEYLEEVIKPLLETGKRFDEDDANEENDIFSVVQLSTQANLIYYNRIYAEGCMDVMSIVDIIDNNPTAENIMMTVTNGLHSYHLNKNVFRCDSMSIYQDDPIDVNVTYIPKYYKICYNGSNVEVFESDNIDTRICVKITRILNKRDRSYYHILVISDIDNSNVKEHIDSSMKNLIETLMTMDKSNLEKSKIDDIVTDVFNNDYFQER